MNQIKKILVGVDFSECSRAALLQAARIAAWNGAAVHVLHVIDALAVAELSEALHQPAERQQATAVSLAERELARWLGPAGLPPAARAEAVLGDPLAEILKRAGAIHADLIVVGAQGGNARSPEAGTLALQLLQRAAAKVLLVDIAHTTPFRRIVAGVDFSETAREVVEQARRVAAQDGGRVDFLHVYYGPWHRVRYLMPTPEAMPDFEAQYMGLLRRQLEDFVGDVTGFDAARVLYEASHAGRGIADYARKTRADLLVVGTRGRWNLRDNLLGSTAERLLTALPCSVLAIRPPAGA